MSEVEYSNPKAKLNLWVDMALLTIANGSLEFDYEQIIKDALERCRNKLEYTTLATEFLTEPFSIGDLRRIYESVWNTKLTQSNFHRKVKSIEGFLIPTAKMAKRPYIESVSTD